MAVFIYVPSTSDIEREDVFKKKGWRADPRSWRNWGKKPRRRVTKNPITKRKKKSLLSKTDAERVLNRHVEENETIDIVKTIVMADIEKTEFCDG